VHDAEQIRRFPGMTPAERWEIWRELTDLGWAIWEANLDASEIERRLAAWRREHDLSDDNMLRAFRSAK
jgi:hypothetical protein